MFLEYPTIKIYAVHPGSIATKTFAEIAPPIGATETLELPAATFLWLTARNAEFLNGRLACPLTYFDNAHAVSYQSDTSVQRGTWESW